MKAILARKVGMTRMISKETGDVVPVTVLEVPATKVLQVKSEASDGYRAAVLAGFERTKKGKNLNQNYKYIKECPLSEDEEMKKGASLGIDTLKDVENVSIVGISKGRGFSGVIKRHNFGRGPETHGSHHHREPGSVGTCAKPGRIMKGRKMPGQYGVDRTSLRGVKVVDVDTKKNLIAVKGAVPGAKNAFVFICEYK